MASGPLSGLKIIEFAGIGPVPFCGMLLSDLGADVIRIDRKAAQFSIGIRGTRFAVTERGRRSIALDLKQPAAIELCLRLITGADALFEGFRPGVMERLGLGPDVVLSRKPSLVYGRMTGWGQQGPWADNAGHDINYIALSGALDAIGNENKPLAPLNLVGDFGGGAMYLAVGMLAAVIHARETGNGQVVDAAMSDGAASLMSMFYGLKAAGMMSDGRRRNLLDGGAHFYDTYLCADGKWVAIGSIEPQFYRVMLDKLGIADRDFDAQMDREKWPALKEKIASTVRSKSRAEWCDIMAGSDSCFSPVLDMDEAPEHPHNRTRETFTEFEGVIQPAPAPRFSKTPGSIQGPPPTIGEHNETVLRDWGIPPSEIETLRAAEIV